MENKKIGEWRHIILYAKGWYKKTDTMEDLRKIISNITGSETRFILDDHIYENVAEVFNHSMSQYEKDVFFRKLFISRWYIPSNTIDIITVIDRMLSELSCLQVQDGDTIIFDIGEPDENVLPFSKEGK